MQGMAEDPEKRSGASADCQRSGSPPTEVPWYATDAIMLIAMFIVTSFSVQVVAVLLLGKENPWALVPPLLVSPVLTLALAYVVLRVRVPKDAAVAPLIGLRLPGTIWPYVRALRPALVGLAAIYALAQAQGALLEYLRIDPTQLPKQPVVDLLHKSDTPALTILVSLFAVLMAPFTEEVLFRGMLYLPLRSRMGPVLGGALASLVFAAVHYYALGFAHLFVVALILTALFEVTGTLFVPMVAHAVHNGIAIAVLLGATH